MSDSVRAAVMHGPGDVRIEEFPMPVVDAESGLLKVDAAALVGTDYEYFSGRVSDPKKFKQALTFPYIPGHIITGRIDKLGELAKQRWGVEEGDRVLMHFNVTCGYCERCQRGQTRLCPNMLGYGLWNDYTKPPYLWGGAAEYMMLAPRSRMVKIPEGQEPGSVLLLERLADGGNWLLEHGRLTAHDSVAIFGTGALAQAATVVAKISGASPIIAVGRSTSGRLEQMKRLGADHVFAGDHDEVLAGIAEVTGGRMVNVGIDITSRDAHEVTRLAVKALGHRGRLVQVAMREPHDLVGVSAAEFITKELQLVGVRGHEPRHTEWAATCLTRPEATLYLESNVTKYELAGTKAALEHPPTLDGAALAAVYPEGVPQ